MNNYEGYLFKILFLTSVFLLIVASISYIYDPAGIYHNSFKKHNSPSMYADCLSQGMVCYGQSIPGIDVM